MNDTVVQLRQFSVVPSVGSTYQITGDTLSFIDVGASAFRASFQIRS